MLRTSTVWVIVFRPFLFLTKGSEIRDTILSYYWTTVKQSSEIGIERREKERQQQPQPQEQRDPKQNRMDFSNFPRRGYLQGPTPIEPLPNLTRLLLQEEQQQQGKNGVSNDDNNDNDMMDYYKLYVKRDDLLPGACGGNKTRKLDFCLADALEQQADCIVTTGAVQSNHCRLTAAWAAKEGLECHLVLEERVENSYKPDASGNNFLFHLLGVKGTRVVPGGADVTMEMEKTAAALRARGKKPYIVPGGASNATGALGYAACAEEIVQQLQDMQLPNMDYIVLPSGSAGTHAGMVAGLAALDKLNNEEITVWGMNTSRPKKMQEDKVHALAVQTAQLLGIDADRVPAVCCFDDYVGDGYSLPTDAMIEAVKLFAQTEAILLDPVYTGKAAAGFIDLIRKRAFPKGSNILFLHTGGSPALYAYMDTFRQQVG